MKYRMVVLDIDGTTLDSNGRIPAPVRDAVARTQAAGVKVVLATGRTLRLTLPVARELRLAGPVITDNGALTSDLAGGSTLHAAVLPPVAAWRALTLLEGLNLAVAVCRPHLAEADVLYRRPLPDTALWAFPGLERGRSLQYAPNLEAICAIGALKLVCVDQAARVRQGLQVLENRAIEGCRSLVMSATPGYELLEVLPAGTNKAAAAARLAVAEGIDRSEVIAVGDNVNDLEMIRWAGVGVAMGNAVPAVKAAADLQVAGNDDAGVAAALDALLFAPTGVQAMGGMSGADPALVPAAAAGSR